MNYPKDIQTELDYLKRKIDDQQAQLDAIHKWSDDIAKYLEEFRDQVIKVLKTLSETDRTNVVNFYKLVTGEDLKL